MPKQNLTKEYLNSLLSTTDEPCISLYMPTHRSHPENKQDLIRYKNQVKQVRDSITEKYPTAELNPLLEQFDELGNDQEFWSHATEGLAVLGSSNHFELIRLQQSVESLVMVSDNFLTKPLWHVLQSMDRYHVLALSLNAVHLYEGNRHSLDEIELSDDFPTKMEIILGEEVAEKKATLAAVGSHNSNRFHGHEKNTEEVDVDAEHFFRLVGNAVFESYSKPTGLQLVLATLPEHHALFTQVDKNQFLVSDGIEIDPQSISIEKLAELSWDVMKPIFTNNLTKIAEKFSKVQSKGLGSDTMDDVRKAAESGRVDTLLLEAHRFIGEQARNKVTGTFETADLTQPVLEDQLDELGDLVNQMGGTVIMMPKNQMPTKTGLAAIYRY